MHQSHLLPRHTLVVLKLLGAFFLTAALLLALAAALGSGPSSANAAPAAQGTPFNCGTVTQIPEAECQALVSLYNNTDGDHWRANNRWLQNPTPCGDGAGNTWYGVTCSAGHVATIQLGHNNLRGRLSSDLAALSYLTVLNLSENWLTDQIPPELGSISTLTSLEIFSNTLTGGIPYLGNLTNLEVLNLSTNQFQSGPIPSELTGLSRLAILNLGKTNRTSGIPEGLSSLIGLKKLELYGNLLNGSIPFLGNLTNLEVLNLSENPALNGLIPPEVISLTKLTVLNLGDTWRTGQIPAWLGNLTNLKRLILYKDSLTGTIPYLGNLSNLEALKLYMLDLDSGPIPSEVADLTHLSELWLATTNRTGPILDLTQLPNLQNVHLGNNLLTGRVPDLMNLPNMRELYLGTNSLSGTIPSGVAAHPMTLAVLDLNSNQLTGPVPQELCNLTRTTTRTLALDYNALDLTPAPNCPEVIDWRWIQTQTVPPTDIRATAVSTSSIQLTWTRISYQDHGGGYEISYSTVPAIPPTNTVVITNVPKSADSFTVTNLAAATTYHFVVRTHTPPHSRPGTGNPNDLWSAYSLNVTATTQIPAGTLVTVKRERASGAPAANVQLWVDRNGHRIKEVTTNQHGQYVFSDLQTGDLVVAVDQQLPPRMGDEPDAALPYRVYLTSMEVGSDGAVTATQVTQPGQLLPALVIKRTNPLILFDLQVSVEANVEVDALEALSSTLRQASAFLYDVSDGQFALGDVTIRDAAEEYRDADMRVPANRQGIPNALVGGIVTVPFSYTNATGNTIVYGPGFFRMTPDWPTDVDSQTCGPYCRTLVHELAHYAFFLYDEYYIIQNGERQPAYCTASNLTTATEATNASIMDKQVNATSELAMKWGAEPWVQWSRDCENTEQWRLHGESDWETVANVYSDNEAPQPRWILTTPAMINKVNPGPIIFPFPALTDIITSNTPITNPISIPTVTVQLSNNTPCDAQCQVYSRRETEQPSVILGLGSPMNGAINVPGLRSNDELVGITTDGAYFGSQIILTSGQTLTLHLSDWNPQTGVRLQADETALWVTVIVTTSVQLGGNLEATLMDLGAREFQTITLRPSGTNVYTGTFEITRSESAQEGYIWIEEKTMNSQHLQTVTSFAIAGVPGSHEWGYLDLNSLEGTLNLLAPPGGVPANTSVIVLPVRHLESLPVQTDQAAQISVETTSLKSRNPQQSRLSFVGTGYYLGTTGDTSSTITATLTLYYGSGPGADPEHSTYYIYHYNDRTSQWESKGGVTDRETHSVSASINRFGTYALATPFYSYLPMVMVGHEGPHTIVTYLPMIIATTTQHARASR